MDRIGSRYTAGFGTGGWHHLYTSATHSPAAGRGSRPAPDTDAGPRDRLKPMPAKPEIRRQIRRRRRALSKAERQSASVRITAILGRLHLFSAARRIAVFAANDGEIDPGPAMRYHAGKQYYLPVIRPDGRRRMRFARVGPETTFRNNRYGIPEPDVPARQLVTALELDLVLAPLVAFDRDGGRLGMGGGYYDETFAFLASRENWHRPKLVGVAFSFQEVPHIVRDPWDIPLSAVITERGVVAVPGGRST